MELNNYDKVLNTLYINLYTLSKDSNIIELKNFNYKNKAHLVVLKVASILASLCNKKIKCNISFLNYLYIKKFYKNIKIKRGKHFSIDKDCDTLISDIEQYYEKGIFEKIYKEYYEVKK